MHENDFELLSRQELPDGRVELEIAIKAAGLTRVYLCDPQTGSVSLEGEPLLVGGYDMTSIIGKRVREWIRSSGVL